MSNTKTPDGERTKHGGPADAGLLELERQIATGAAKGLTGVAVKLRLADSILKEMHRDELHLPEIVSVQSALETVERLLIAGKNAG